MILAVSPHLDDAVLSAGAWLSWHPGAVVATVFAGEPYDAVLTPYDREAGFTDGHEAIQARRAEDVKACAAVGAVAQHLPLVQGSYRGPHAYSHQLLTNVLVEIADELQPETIVAPLGIVHPDHIAVAAAAWHAFKGRPGCALLFAEDLPYRVGEPADAVFEVAAKGLVWHEDICPDDERAMQAKVRAIKEYRSALWSIPSFVYFTPERLWECR